MKAKWLSLIALCACWLEGCGDTSGNFASSSMNGRIDATGGVAAGVSSSGGSVNFVGVGGSMAPGAGGAGLGSGATPGSGGSGGGSEPSGGQRSGGSGQATGGVNGTGGSASSGGSADTGTYECTLILGILTTGEWYTEGGFETLVNDAKWELQYVHSGHVELWADASDPIWNTTTTSPCASRASTPDRVLYVAANYDYALVTEWKPKLESVVANIKSKYPGAKRIELGTWVRAPGNVVCSGTDPARTTIGSAEDQAISEVAAENPGLVYVSPKFEAKTCSEFSEIPPHGSETGVVAWAQMIAEHYGLGK